MGLTVLTLYMYSEFKSIYWGQEKKISVEKLEEEKEPQTMLLVFAKFKVPI